MAYIISLTVTDLTGGGEQFLMQQAEGGNSNIYWIAGMMFLHMVFTVFPSPPDCREGTLSRLW